MKIDLKKIFTSWSIAINPTERQSELAEKRWEICKICPSKIETLKDKEWSFRCKDCGCQLKSKIFTNNHDACPNHFWVEVEKPFFNIKETKTLL